MFKIAGIIKPSTRLTHSILQFYNEVKQYRESFQKNYKNDPKVKKIQSIVDNQIDGNIIAYEDFDIYENDLGNINLKNNIFDEQGKLPIQITVYVYDGLDDIQGMFRQDIFNIFLNLNNYEANISSTINHELVHMIDMLLYISNNIKQRPANASNSQLQDIKKILIQNIKDLEDTATNRNKKNVGILTDIDTSELKKKDKNAQKTAYLSSFLYDINNMISNTQDDIRLYALEQLINNRGLIKLEGETVRYPKMDSIIRLYYMESLEQIMKTTQWNKIKNVIDRYKNNYPQRFKILVKEITNYCDKQRPLKKFNPKNF